MLGISVWRSKFGVLFMSKFVERAETDRRSGIERRQSKVDTRSTKLQLAEGERCSRLDNRLNTERRKKI